MPAPYWPALRRAAARGLKVVRGGETAAERRAASLERRAAGVPAASPGEGWRIINADTGEVRQLTRRAPGYSPEATEAQAGRGEALRRRAEASGEPLEDPRTWSEDPSGDLRREAGLEGGPAAWTRGSGGQKLREEFQQRYGWDPQYMEEDWVRQHLSFSSEPLVQAPGIPWEAPPEVAVGAPGKWAKVPRPELLRAYEERYGPDMARLAGRQSDEWLRNAIWWWEKE